MATTVRVCPSCKTTLPPDAIFCHKCGASTPMEIDAATGEIKAAELNVIEDAARRAKLQAAIGDTVEIRRLLGRGGFAEVYVAYDKRLKREIAVKTIRGDLVVNDTLLERFQREAEAVAKLRHPHVIPIYSVGEANGIAFFTMPLIEGESLADLLDREGRLSVAESCRILREAANALHSAHRVGLVHRDIKPENIMLEGPERTAVVMDFGIAKSDTPDSKGLTGTGMLVGTPQYMSPEQATGERALDARSDQYSLAMVGYRMLTGRFPFAGDTVQQLIFKTVTEIPVPASDLSSDVPKEVSNVLAKALAKDPAERYESMAAFALAIAATDRDAEGVRGFRGFRRPEPDMATRIRQGLDALPRLTHPLVLLGIVGLVAALITQPRLHSRTGQAVAASRSDAVFAAKAFLTQRGIPVTAGAYPEFVTRNKQQRFLEETIGRDSTNRRAASDIPLWLWNVKFGTMPSGSWSVRVGPDNRILEFTREVKDTAQLPTIAHDSARTLAAHELGALGWPIASMKLVTDSTVRRKRREDHVFRWQKPTDGVVWKSDTAFVHATATVRGNQVTDVGTSLRTPESYDVITSEHKVRLVVTVTGWALAVIMCGFAYAFGVTRQRIDQLQWKTVIRLLGAAALMLVLIFIPKLIASAATSTDGGDIFGAMVGWVILVGVVGSALLFAGVVGESIAREKRPAMVQGMEDVSRGRLAIPEVMTGVFWGYVMSFVTAGVGAAVALIAWRVVHARSAVGMVTTQFSMALPSLSGVEMLGAGLLFGLSVLYAVAFFTRFSVTARLAFILPGVIATALFAGQPDVLAVSFGASILMLSFTIWRFGFIAGVISFWVADMLKDGIALVSSGVTEFVTAGLVTLALVAVPLAFALLLLRRYRGSAQHGARVPGATPV